MELATDGVAQCTPDFVCHLVVQGRNGSPGKVVAAGTATMSRRNDSISKARNFEMLAFRARDRWRVGGYFLFLSSVWGMDS